MRARPLVSEKHKSKRISRLAQTSTMNIELPIKKPRPVLKSLRVKHVKEMMVNEKQLNELLCVWIKAKVYSLYEKKIGIPFSQNLKDYVELTGFYLNAELLFIVTGRYGNGFQHERMLDTKKKLSKESIDKIEKEHENFYNWLLKNPQYVLNTFVDIPSYMGSYVMEMSYTFYHLYLALRFCDDILKLTITNGWENDEFLYFMYAFPSTVIKNSEMKIFHKVTMVLPYSFIRYFVKR